MNDKILERLGHNIIKRFKIRKTIHNLGKSYLVNKLWEVLLRSTLTISLYVVI